MKILEGRAALWHGKTGFPVQETTIYKICDRRHHKDEVPAVITDKLSLNGHRYEIDLCQPCSDQLEALITQSWGGAGTKVGEPTVFDSARKVVEMVARPKPKVERITDSRPRREKEVVRTSKWSFTKHATIRLAQRELTLEEVLDACQSPERVAPLPNEDGEPRQARIRGNVRAVVDASNWRIITVINLDMPEDPELSPELAELISKGA